MNRKKIFWLAGEKSGDLHASKVLEYCLKVHPDWEHFGVGGMMMAAQGFTSIFPFARFNVMGFAEVIKHLLFFFKVEKEIKKIFLENKPDAIVLVDYPGLNMRIARLAKKMNIKVLYYICPQFWAWKKHRIFQLRDHTDAIGYILPFEGDYFRKYRISATYTGHPISEEIEFKVSRDDFAREKNLDLSKKWISFFPGSRSSEIGKLLPEYLKAIRLLGSEKYQFLISMADTGYKDAFEKIISHHGSINLKIIEGNSYELMQHSDFVCAKSGTTTLETAYCGTPFIICYKTSHLSYLLGRYFVKIRWIGLPNIVFNDNVIPELIQNEVNPQNICLHIRKYLENPSEYREMKESLGVLHDMLGKKSASEEVTKLLEGLLK
jgi:lipid-A-disaccharide synthase